MKRLLHKIHLALYHYHRKKMYKYLCKSIGAKRYLKTFKTTRREMKDLRNAFYGISVYADTDSVKR